MAEGFYFSIFWYEVLMLIFFGPDTDHAQGFFFSLAQKRFH